MPVSSPITDSLSDSLTESPIESPIESDEQEALLSPQDTFVRRHLGPSDGDLVAMLATLDVSSVEALIASTIPASIRLQRDLDLAGLPPERPLGEVEVLDRLAHLAQKNQARRSLIGMGYHDCVVPGVIARNIFEDPGWYTQYTPYQAEISQGRLEALLNFQTMVADLTALPVANASLLDEATAAAEAMGMCHGVARGNRRAFFVAQTCHPQTIAVVRTRALPLGIDVLVGDAAQQDFAAVPFSGVLLQYPDTYGRIGDWRAVAEAAKESGALVVMATDLLALTLLTPPGELGADIAVGSAQRFGVPLGYGGPHAAFLATTDALKRHAPGRIVGVSRDRHGRPAYRMALQTREQHIRRERATSNICTAQALLAILASMYAVYHGPAGLRAIARRIMGLTELLARTLSDLLIRVEEGPHFDTLLVHVVGQADAVLGRAEAVGINVRRVSADAVGIALDERSSVAEVRAVAAAVAGRPCGDLPSVPEQGWGLPAFCTRTSPFLTHRVFSSYHSEHEMLRYINRLRARDLSLAQAMIPLGSCTMKLNATMEMAPIGWEGFAALHPFAPVEQAQGYAELFASLCAWLTEITGFAAVSLQPNAGAQGEYAGLLVIRAYLASQGQGDRDVCLIPVSAHGTNPASAVMAGMRVVTVACDTDGNIDVADLRAKVATHRGELAALMVTYPSTHGVFEVAIGEICAIVHTAGGQVYLDGANMNAQVGLCRPGDYGADVCHLNLHKTFAIPHGGGGPGMGPICVATHLAPYLPGHPVVPTGGARASGVVSAAPWGSAGILPISWAYICGMGAAGLRRASEMAIVAANYVAVRLSQHYSVLFRGTTGRVAHELIIDLRPFKASAGIEAEDVAKRLMDYGFHAPTMSFPVPGTLMIEPTESESKAELDRFCDALVAIREEIRKVEEGVFDAVDNPLKNAPHTAREVAAETWSHSYSRETAVYPAPWLDTYKFWPHVGRVDNVWGDRNLVCTRPVEL